MKKKKKRRRRRRKEERKREEPSQKESTQGRKKITEHILEQGCQIGIIPVYLSCVYQLRVGVCLVLGRGATKVFKNSPEEKYFWEHNSEFKCKWGPNCSRAWA
jgi:hypothetical protein